MLRTKVAGAAVAVAALAAGPLAAMPAHAQEQQAIVIDLPCEIFAYPYGYPCGTAEDVVRFALTEAGDAAEFVVAVRDEAGGVVFRAYCTVFPNQPECP